MTFGDGRMPPGTDLVEMWPAEGSNHIRLQCLVCGVSLGTAKYLNQAITMWTNHQAEFLPFNPDHPDRHNVWISSA